MGIVPANMRAGLDVHDFFLICIHCATKTKSTIAGIWDKHDSDC